METRELSFRGHETELIHRDLCIQGRNDLTLVIHDGPRNAGRPSYTVMKALTGPIDHFPAFIFGQVENGRWFFTPKPEM